jgi:DNA-binding response OmpR family regulator
MIKEQDFKLLIIDDETELLEAVVSQVKILGYKTIYAASSYEAALPFINKVDGIISDVNMPRKEDLAKLLRESGVPVIRFSAEPQRVVNFMLQKPFTPQKLKGVLDRLRMFATMAQEDSSKVA